MDCLVWEGFGNRINALASALTTTEDTVNLYWAVNKHLPLKFEGVFSPIKRVKVVNVNAARFEYSRLPHRICHYYLCNPKQIRSVEFSNSVLNYYRLLFNNFKRKIPISSKMLPPSSVGIHYRHYLPETANVADYLESCKAWINSRPVKPKAVFIASDHKESAKFLQACIPGAFLLESDDGMVCDFDRVRSIKSWFESLVIFSQCRNGIYSSCARSTAFDVLRGIGIRTYFDECERHDRSINLESAIMSAMKDQL